MTVASRRPRSSPALSVCGIRLGCRRTPGPRAARSSATARDGSAMKLDSSATGLAFKGSSSMTSLALTPVEIRRVDNREIHITWADGHCTAFPNKRLRESCPCAACVSEVTGRRMLDPASIPADIRAEEISLVGRYAIKVRWSDRHSTGIYTFQKLREWCPCESC